MVSNHPLLWLCHFLSVEVFSALWWEMMRYRHTCGFKEYLHILKARAIKPPSNSANLKLGSSAGWFCQFKGAG